MKIKVTEISSDKNLPPIDFILSDLKRFGVVQLNCNNYEIGQTLLKYLSENLGLPSIDDVTNPNIEIPYIHEVKKVDSTIIDKNGFIPYSLTNKELSCHTEDYFNAKASNIILFYCVRKAEIGGETYLVNIDEIINDLTPTEIEFLSNTIFPTPTNLTSILTYSQSEKKYHIKYSRIIINKVESKEPNRVTSEMITVFNKLDKLLSEHKTVFQLAENSCIILDNTRVLHGRSSFNENSDRLIFRIKLNSQEL